LLTYLSFKIHTITIRLRQNYMVHEIKYIIHLILIVKIFVSFHEDTENCTWTLIYIEYFHGQHFNIERNVP